MDAEAQGAVEPASDRERSGAESARTDAGGVASGGASVMKGMGAPGVDGVSEAVHAQGRHHGHGHDGGHTFHPSHLLAWEEERMTRLGGRERVAEMLTGVPPNGLVVDVGAGVGSFALALAEELPHGRVVAIDHQADMVATLRRRAQERGLIHLEALEGRAEHLPLPPATADLVLFSMVLHDMADPKAVLAEAHRVLRPGGALYVLEFMPGQAEMGPPAERLFEPDRLKVLLTAAAFTGVEIRLGPGPLYRAVARAGPAAAGGR